MVDELPRLQQDTAPDSYTAQQMDLEIQRVARELYKAFSGQNTGFKEVQSIVCLSKPAKVTFSVGILRPRTRL